MGKYRKTGAPRRENSDRGAAAEHLVVAECLYRGLPTGGPYNQNGKHDLFVKAGGGWKTVQVKMARINITTGKLSLHNRRGIESDLIAAVDLEGKRIRWISNTDEPVPEELTRCQTCVNMSSGGIQNDQVRELRTSGSDPTEQPGAVDTDNNEGKERLPAGSYVDYLVLHERVRCTSLGNQQVWPWDEPLADNPNTGAEPIQKGDGE